MTKKHFEAIAQTLRDERVTLTDEQGAAERVTAWLDDDEALRIPDTEWGLQLYADLRTLAARGAAYALEETAKSLADYFARENPRFDRDKFLTACGL